MEAREAGDEVLNGSYRMFLLAGAGAVLAYDVVASLASMVFGLPYSTFSIGSIAIYVVTGYVAAPRFGQAAAVLASVWVALVESTLGWALSWFIGPGRVTGPDATPAAIVLTSAIVGCGMGSAMGFIGAKLALRTSSQPEVDHPETRREIP